MKFGPKSASNLTPSEHAAIVTLLQGDDVVIMTSTIARTEVFQNGTAPAAQAKYAALKASPSFQEIVVSGTIADRAGEIRQNDPRTGAANKDSRQNKISTPDAIHVATAILYAANELWTLDNGILVLDQKLRAGLRFTRPYATLPMLPDLAEQIK
jgi:predicted nucleic acid-binding protein